MCEPQMKKDCIGQNHSCLSEANFFDTVLSSCIRFLVSDGTLFFSVAEKPQLCVCILFTRSSVGGQLGWFHI